MMSLHLRGTGRGSISSVVAPHSHHSSMTDGEVDSPVLRSATAAATSANSNPAAGYTRSGASITGMERQ